MSKYILMTGILLMPVLLKAQKTPYKIPLSTDTKYWDGDTVFYQINDVNGAGTWVDNLFDEQELDPLNDKKGPLKTPFFESGPGTKVYYPSTAVIDLGGTYRITNEFTYNVWGTDTLYVLYGSPENWGRDTLRHYSGGKGWYDFGKEISTRYLKVFYRNSGYQKIRELILYGYLEGKDSLSRINPNPTGKIKPTPLTMGQFIGFNQIGPREVDSVGSLMRHYMELSWTDTVTTTHDINKIKFVFSIFRHSTNNTDKNAGETSYFFPEGPENSVVKQCSGLAPYDLHQMALNGTGYFDVTQGIPAYADAKHQNSKKPIDKVNHPGYDATDPKSYDRLSRWAWTYGAYYGSKKYPSNLMQTPYPEISGLGLRSIVETGNEMNQDWSGREKHFTPEEFIAYSSAYYDGDNGRMGERMGIKNADPDMLVLQAGTAGAHIDYLRGLRYYSYYTRKDHSAPFDALNIHIYPSNGTNGKGTNANGFSPEEYFNTGDNPIQNYIREASELFPGMSVWLTEWGYDRNRATKISVPVIAGKDSAQIQAEWIARFWFFLSFSGVERSTIFQLRNDPLPTMYDSAGTVTFNTTGLTEGHYVANEFSREYATSWYAYPAYYFQRTIWLRLYNYKPDSILQNGEDGIYIFRYENAKHADSIAYAIWSGTKTNRIVRDFLFQTGNPNGSARVVQLTDKKFTGEAREVKTDPKGNISLTISEAPQLIFVEKGSITSDETEPDHSRLEHQGTVTSENGIRAQFKDPETGKIHSMKIEN